MTGQTHPKSPIRVKEVNNTEPIPIIDIVTEEHQEESMIYVESFDENLGNKIEKDVIEQMDVEYPKNERFVRSLDQG